MSPRPEIPQKEGEPVSERIAQAETLLWAIPDGAEIGGEQLEAICAILADAKGRAVAQEAEGRRLRDALEKIATELRALGTSDVNDPGWREYIFRVTGAISNLARAALSGSSETPGT